MSVGAEKPERECRLKTIVPGLSSVSARMTGARKRKHKPRQVATVPAGETNEPKECRIGSRSILIVLSRAGNRGHRDPNEGRGMSYVQIH